MKTLIHRPLWLLCMSMAACGNLSGLDGSSTYACKAPAGVSCRSVSAVYASHAETTASGTQLIHPPTLPAVTQQPSLLGAPLRSPPRVLRLWFKPWVDSDNDLYDQGYVYVQIDDGHWLLEGAQNRIRAAYAPRLQPPATASTSPAQARPSASPTPLPVRELPIADAAQPPAGEPR